MTITNEKVDALAEKFIERFKERLVMGATEYQNKSFDRPSSEIRGEILEELEDCAVWSFILWVRVSASLERLDTLRDK
jgi:hypothetical protein